MNTERLSVGTKDYSALTHSPYGVVLTVMEMSYSSNPTFLLACVSLRKRSMNKRHNSIVQTWTDIVKLAGGNSYIEPTDLLEFNRTRPDTENVFADGRHLTDTSIICPTAPSYIVMASRGRPLRCAGDREQRKRRKYDDMATREGAQFLPLVFEAYGGRGTTATEYLRLLARKASELPHATLTHAQYCTYFSQLLAICLQKGNYRVERQGMRRMRDAFVRQRTLVPSTVM